MYGWGPGQGVTPPDMAEQMIENAPPEAVDAITAYTEDSSTTMRHINCCAQAGCPDGTCTTIVADSGGLEGDELLAYITGQ